jgi:hypothetical protein
MTLYCTTDNMPIGQARYATLADFSVEHPDVGLPRTPEPSDLAPFNWYIVQAVQRPPDTRDTRYSAAERPTGSGSDWQQAWDSRAATPEEQQAWDDAVNAPDLRGLERAMKETSAYRQMWREAQLENGIKSTAFAKLDLAMTAAANGGYTYKELQAAIWEATYRFPSLTAEQIAEIDAALATANLTYSSPTRQAVNSVIEEWTQPEAGVDDGYPIDAQVRHQERFWVSLLDANFYEPGAAGWRLWLEEGSAHPFPDWQLDESTTAYALGDRVHHAREDRTPIYWESKIDANTTTPGNDFVEPSIFYDRYWGPIDADGDPLNGDGTPAS